MQARIGVRALLIAASLLLAVQARAETVSYTANLSTSKGNPVTDLLILETDGIHPVQATAYPAAVPGRGLAVISHEVPFRPARSLLIGLTQGSDENGADKTQLVMFLAPAFAAVNAGLPFSSVFPGARHSATVTSLQAAVAGDAAQLAWFTDTFFSGPAAGAAFDSRGPFAVAEFTSLKVIGQNATAGNWMITGFDSLSASDPGAQSGKVTAVIAESAKTDPGPFDIQLRVDGDGVFAIDKSVFNDTDAPWREFVLQLGSGIGAAFVPSTPGDGLGFDASLNNREETGAFPNAVVDEDRIAFSGFLAPGDTARFVVFVKTATTTAHLVTLRQIAVDARPARAPALQSSALALLVALLCGIAWARLQRTTADR